MVLHALESLIHTHTHIRPSPHLGWFGGHLDAGLQYGDGEAGMGVATEPQTEVRVWLLGLQLLLHNLVQLRHPAEGEVAVGQKHPVTLYIVACIKLLVCDDRYHACTFAWDKLCALFTPQ